MLAVLAFAVGIGSTTAIFAVINGVLLRPLPYADASRFVVLFGANTTEPSRFSANKFPDLIEFERRLSSVDAFGWFSLADFNLTSPGEPQRVAGATLTPSLARSLGVTPHLGGWFTDETGVVISTRLWRRLGGSPTIVGSPVTIDGRSFTITGVMPPDFRFPIAGTVPLLTRTDLWTYLDPAGQGLNRGDSIYFSYARRKPGISVAEVEADARRVAAQIAALDPAAHPAYTAKVVALRETPFIELRAELFVMFGAAGLLLLISCANVATLLLARSVSRVRETAIRVALGAARRHLALRYLVESLLVSIAGAAAGMILSVGLVRAIAAGGSELIPQAEDIGIDWKVFGAATLLAFVASALASAAPLWQAVRIAPNAVLADGVRASASARVRRLSHALVVGEIGLAFMLLAVSTVLVVHLDALTRVSPGFTPDDLVAFEIAAPRTVFRTKGRWAYQKRLLDAVAQIPGVSTAAFVNQLPLDGCCLGGVLYPEGTTTVDTRRISFLVITSDYFATMGIPLRAGRFLTERDTSDGLLFCVVNQAAATRYWPNQNPVGAYARLNLRDGNRVQVIGVVGDVRNEALKSPPEAELYLLASLIPVSPMKFVVRAPLPPSRLIAEIQRTVQRVDPTVVVHDARPMAALVHDSLQLERISSAIMTFFALAALLMATLGIYGVVSYSVRQRTVELGTRMAVGAVPRDLLKLVVGGALKMAALGVTLGGFAVVGGVWLLVRYLEVRDISAAPFIFSTIVVVAIVAAASYMPAWRASLLPPMVAIRDDPASA